MYYEVIYMKSLESNQGSLFKICIVGDGGVGKTAIIDRFLGKKFQTGYKLTIGAEIKVYAQDIDGKEIKYQIWDLAGQPRFKFVRSSFYKGSHAVIMVFDLTEIESLFNLFSWKQEVFKNIGYVIPLMILGNKNDLQDPIEKRIIRDCIKKLKYEFLLAEISYFSTSALNGQNISDAFRAIGRILLRTPLIDLYQNVIIAK